jgi:hypothetical protein
MELPGLDHEVGVADRGDGDSTYRGELNTGLLLRRGSGAAGRAGICNMRGSAGDSGSAGDKRVYDAAGLARISGKGTGGARRTSGAICGTGGSGTRAVEGARCVDDERERTRATNCGRADRRVVIDLRGAMVGNGGGDTGAW